jgi:hypothetical protein
VINGLDVGVTDVAALDAHVGKLIRSVDMEFGLVFLAASGTDDAPKFPIAETETGHKIAARTVAPWAQDGEDGLAIAERALRMDVAVELQPRTGADEFGVGLKEREGEEFLGSGGRFVGGGPAFVQQLRPGT